MKKTLVLMRISSGREFFGGAPVPFTGKV